MSKKEDGKEIVVDRKEKIIEEATILFYKNGYDNSSIRELSKAAGLSVAGVYYFFVDKEDILFYILKQSIIDMVETIKNAVSADDDPKTNLERIIKDLLRHVIKHKMEITILNREDTRLNEEQRETIYQKRREAFALVKNQLIALEKHENMKLKSYTPATFLIFSMTTWFVRWYDPKGSRTFDEIADEMSSIFFVGVLNS